VGSVTKSFTATTAMVLVADGDLELDAPLADHLERGELGERMTLRQLLSHTAGLPTGPDSEDVGTASVRPYVRDHCRAAGLLLPPGTGFSYSNLGYVLVGHLIETITGMDWWSALESILLRPLGIQPAAIVGPGSVTGRPLATGHSVSVAAGRIRPVRQSLAGAEAAAGALAVSATDLVALGRLHLDGGDTALLPAGQAARMREAVGVAEPFGLADGWGLGLAVFDADGTRWFGHDGNSDGTACHLRVDPGDGSGRLRPQRVRHGRAVLRHRAAAADGEHHHHDPAAAAHPGLAARPAQRRDRPGDRGGGVGGAGAGRRADGRGTRRPRGPALRGRHGAGYRAGDRQPDPARLPAAGRPQESTAPAEEPVDSQISLT
jgi:hypothetical protein